jgi:aryl-alcohol dehydrogenase-like predicted oxidoreductase
MKYNFITKDILVSRISYGTGSIHHIFSQKDRLNLLSNAFNLGITHFDTSPYYGNGIAEYSLGKFSENKRNQITITSKIGLYPIIDFQINTFGLWSLKLASKLFSKLNQPIVNSSLKKAQKSLNSSLLKLNSEYIDFLFLHEPIIELYRTDEFLKWLEYEKKIGRIREYGISGLKESIIPFLKYQPDFTKIIQTKDHGLVQDANFLYNYGRELQFTYGYLSNLYDKNIIEKKIEQGVKRNSKGSIIFSTRNVSHLIQICKIHNSL